MPSGSFIKAAARVSLQCTARTEWWCDPVKVGNGVVAVAVCIVSFAVGGGENMI